MINLTHHPHLDNVSKQSCTFFLTRSYKKKSLKNPQKDVGSVGAVKITYKHYHDDHNQKASQYFHFLKFHKIKQKGEHEPF